MSLFQTFKPVFSWKIKGRNYSNNFRKNSMEPVNLAYVVKESTFSEKSSNPLIVMHGLFGSKSNWNTLCKWYQEKTKPQRKIIALDVRNHGDSPHHPNHSYEVLVLDLKTLMKRLEIVKACLLGHSMGGSIAMLFALNYPTQVEKLIVGDISPTAFKLGNFRDYIKAMKNVKIPFETYISKARVSADIQLMQQGVKNKDVRKFLLTNLIHKSDGSFGWRINLSGLLMNISNLEHFPRKEGQIYEGPTLFIGGADSGFMTNSDIPKIKMIFPKCEFEFIEGAGHWVHSDKRLEFFKSTIEFLNRNG
ncbi:hypothetical protein HHI36_009988 [Cryptolaemus montrouzieri]|uniref:sn-1-specific diacylglycerol lipase ABHD11 n=1 Tax=Cryptolaemus montrouzieri TaxID=559131 RepID=A0ABD2MHE7_9CUCU